MTEVVVPAPEPPCEACRGFGHIADEQDDPCPWCEGSGRADPAKMRTRRLANLATRIERLKASRDAAKDEVEHLDRMVLMVEGQRAALLAEEGG